MSKLCSKFIRSLSNIRDVGGKWAEREKAFEDEYFWSKVPTNKTNNYAIFLYYLSFQNQEALHKLKEELKKRNKELYGFKKKQPSPSSSSSST